MYQSLLNFEVIFIVFLQKGGRYIQWSKISRKGYTTITKRVIQLTLKEVQIYQNKGYTTIIKRGLQLALKGYTNIIKRGYTTIIKIGPKQSSKGVQNYHQKGVHNYY